MSIINDALKKAQKQLEEQGKDPNITEATKVEPSDKATPPPTKPQTSMKRKRAWYKTISTLVPILFLIAGVFLASIFYLILQSDTDQSAGIQKIYQPKKVPQNINPNDLELNGISTIENRRVALINNEIYEEGDMVGRFKVFAVESTLVLLQDNNGDLITLKVK